MDTNFLTTVADVLGVDTAALDRASNSASVVSWDSVRHWDLISTLEASYEVDFTMDEAAGFEHLGHLHDALVTRGVLQGTGSLSDEGDFPLVVEAFEHVTGRYDFLRRGLEESWRADGRTWLADAERVLSLLRRQAGDTRAGFLEALDGYVHLSLEYLKLQAELRRTGRYHFSSFEQARQAVYDNPAVMDRYYLHGVLASTVFWRNHYQVLRAFRDAFVARQREGSGLNVEVGTGHGLFTSLLLEHCPGWRTVGIDLSASSRAYTKRTLGFHGHAPERWAIQAGNIHDLPFQDGALDGLVCGEVLEHLEDPGAALQELRRVVKPSGRAWMTTAIYAANLDHIHLFRTVEEVRELVAEAGWQLETERIVSNDGTAWEQGMRDVPFSYAGILR